VREQVRGGRAYAIEFGSEALVDSLPGVAGGTSFVGAFDREYAVANETIDSPRGALVSVLATSRRMPKVASRGASCAFPAPAAPARRHQQTAEFEVGVRQDGQARRTGRPGPTPPVVRRMKPEDAAEHDWDALVARPAPCSEAGRARRRGRAGPWLNSSRPPRTFPLSRS
jgi:hypothetical protein